MAVADMAVEAEAADGPKEVVVEAVDGLLAVGEAAAVDGPKEAAAEADGNKRK